MSALPFGEALVQIVNGLEQVGVPYFIGGSVATELAPQTCSPASPTPLIANAARR